MSDKLVLENGRLVLMTEEGQTIELPEETLVEMIRREIEPPINGAALPDGVKFIQWCPPLLCVVHQLPAHVRQLNWITDDSPVPYGRGTKFQTRRLSIPYAVTFAIYCQHGNRLVLSGYNELYFRNEPLKSKQDKLGFPALLNVSRINLPGRSRAWICTQHLHYRPSDEWDAQLAALLDHTWNAGFNRSSEHHEGASWYGESKGVHQALHPIEKWEKASAKNDTFALSVPWKPVPMNVEQLMHAMLDEYRSAISRRALPVPSASATAPGLISRLLNFAQSIKTRQKK